MNRHTQTGCTAIVTGAASGLGRGLADALVARGLHVVYADVNGDGATWAAASAPGPGSAQAATLDVSDAGAFAALIEGVIATRGRLDLLINNAGFAVTGEARDTPLHDWRRIVDVNLMGPVHGTLHAYQRMAAQGGGQIVNIASLAGLVPAPLLAAYAMTKGGVVQLSHALRCEGAGLGVQVSVVCPSFIKTSIFANARYHNTTRGATETLMARIPVMDLEPAVRATLAGIDANQATIVFPWHARLLWRATRLMPRVPNPITDMLMRRFRAGRNAG